MFSADDEEDVSDDETEEDSEDISDATEEDSWWRPEDTLWWLPSKDLKKTQKMLQMKQKMIQKSLMKDAFLLKAPIGCFPTYFITSSQFVVVTVVVEVVIRGLCRNVPIDHCCSSKSRCYGRYTSNLIHYIGNWRVELLL